MTNINDFPDEILTHILSFLPFKQAFRTTILSKRWLPLFHSLAVLNIDDEGTYRKKYWYGFRQFLDKIMFSPLSQHIILKSFQLKCDHKLWDARAASSSMNKWIEVAKQRRIEYLNLRYFNVLLVPTTIFCCKTLVVLKLECMHIANMYNCSVDLPSLKTLDLHSVRFRDMENFIRIIYGCPILENLKTKTSYLKERCCVTVGGYYKPLPKLIKGNICLSDVPLKAVCNVQFLSIGPIYNEEIKSYYKDFPVFGNLTDLELHWWYEQFRDWDDVVKILQNCSKLQTLKIIKGPDSTTKEDWKYPYQVPECVSSHLTTCNITGYEACDSDFQFVTYILQNARLLQVMTIRHTYFPKLTESSQFLEDLHSCQMISPSCELNVSILNGVQTK